MEKNLSLRIEKFENSNEVLENTNFHKVKIMIMHTGENYNGSVFSKDSIYKSIKTLANVPILAHVIREEDNKDFGGHDSDFDIYKDEDGSLKIREFYLEQPIGVIPESNDWFTEEIDGETYLGCYGYVWKCYSNDAYDILLEDDEKEVSMEILINDYFEDEKGRCNIEEFEFLGVTCLGKVLGAMGSECTINMSFSADEESKKEYSEAVVKLNKLLNFQRKESVDMDNEKENVLDFAEEDNKEEEACKKKKCSEDEENNVDENACKTKKKCSDEEDEEDLACKKKKCSEDENDTEELACKPKKKCAEDDEEEDVCPKCGKNPCECDDEEDDEEDMACKKKKCSEDDKEEPVEEDEACKTKKKCSEDEEDVEKEACKKKKCSTEEFGLSLNNVFRSIANGLKEYTYTYTSFWGDTFETSKYYMEDLIADDSTFVVYDCEEDKYFGIKYTIENDEVNFDINAKVEYIQEWKAKGTSNRFSCEEESVKREAVFYNMIAEELKGLREFKASIEDMNAKAELEEKVEGILAGFSFEEEEISELKEKVLNKEIDLEKFEDKLCVLEVKKLRAGKGKFSKANEEDNSLKIVDVEQSQPKSKYEDILKKYGKRK